MCTLSKEIQVILEEVEISVGYTEYKVDNELGEFCGDGVITTEYKGIYINKMVIDS